MPTLVIKGIITKGLNIGLKYTTKPKNLGIQNMELKLLIEDMN